MVKKSADRNHQQDIRPDGGNGEPQDPRDLNRRASDFYFGMGSLSLGLFSLHRLQNTMKHQISNGEGPLEVTLGLFVVDATLTAAVIVQTARRTLF